MLIIQQITLTWHKQERGGNYAVTRSRFPFSVPADFNYNSSIVIQHLNFFQDGNRILDAFEFNRLMWDKIRKNDVFKISDSETEQRLHQDERNIRNNMLTEHNCSPEQLRLKNLRFETVGENIDVIFHSDGIFPYITGHNSEYNNENSPLYNRNLVNEKVFCLKPETTGRIIFHERRTDYDNGTWYYVKTCFNLAITSRAENNIFSSQSFDFICDYTENTVLR